ncbi:hypothetical protein BCV69DRAFT_296213 [Microstroma glucosiphilum]|uniref:Eisosome component PIL1-domain-containing protein n=1 Tax=Pseudomicrostroma glucosiphilum TaxID=1684307 RepID=A0A316UG73_9BASI|nr:hypothetical protein BCV69DRAFT_296213 [Pseudomicrostroma glucosiphilum]PWN23904.1 hypothetical protein BCV69DRAFT_296213 [Pseudomicrostroma glucosiphilum]
MLRKTKQQIAHTSIIPVLGNRDLKTLQNVIVSEKTFIKENGDAAQAWHANGDALKAWGEGEGEELSDVLSKLSLLFDHYMGAQERLNSHLSTLRLHFKSVRSREEGLASLKSKKRALASKIESVEKKLSKMGPENKELAKTTAALKEYRGEMQSLTTEVVTEDLAIGDFKRRTAREAMGIKCGGLLEFAEKVTIVAEIGKMMIEEIPLDTTAPGVTRKHYTGHARTDQLLAEANRCISDVGFAPSGQSAGRPRPNLSHLDSGYPTAGEQDARNAHDAYGQYDQDGTQRSAEDAYTGGGGTYSAAADYSGTPIYASHQTSQPWAQEQDNLSFRSAQEVNNNSATGHPAQPEALRDHNLDDRTRSDEAATGVPQSTARQSGDNFSISSAVARLAAQSNEEDQDESLGGQSQRSAAVGEGAQQPISRPTSPPAQPLAPQHSSSAAAYTSAAPSLPPLRVASPIVGEPATPGGEVEEDPYFAAVGSTRAIQAAARRPTSPGVPTASGNRYGSGSVSSFAAFAPGSEHAPTAPSARYEPAESGRKMTAAAFRKGFNRVPSTSQTATLPSTPSSEFPKAVPPRHETASPAVEPLSIRKRYSAVQDADVDDHEIVPPYVAGQSAPHSHEYDESAQSQREQPSAQFSGYPEPNYHHQPHLEDSRYAQRDQYQSAYGGVEDNDEYNEGGQQPPYSYPHQQQQQPQQRGNGNAYSVPRYPS